MRPTMRQAICKLQSHLQQAGGKYYDNSGGKFYYPKFIGDEIGAQRGQETCPAS